LRGDFLVEPDDEIELALAKLVFGDHLGSDAETVGDFLLRDIAVAALLDELVQKEQAARGGREATAHFEPPNARAAAPDDASSGAW